MAPYKNLCNSLESSDPIFESTLGDTYQFSLQINAALANYLP